LLHITGLKLVDDVSSVGYKF